MIAKIKHALYFPIASYFKFFAKIQLFLWKPKIIVITGSTGKTTLLHFIQTQIKQAKYSHHANSAFGIPFDILGLNRKSLQTSEWPYLFLAAPFKAFKKPAVETVYIVETDCDRPGEGKFLASLLKPEVTIWISSSRTHTMNFDQLVLDKKFLSVEDAIAFEYGYFLESTKKLAIVNGDSPLINKQLTRTNTTKVLIKETSQLNSYKILEQGSEFEIENQKYLINYLMPKENFYSIAMTKALLNYLGQDIDPKFPGLNLPPGRSSKFKGIKNISIIDSSYNATPASMKVILEMFQKYKGSKKWVIIGDMVELGQEEQEEHEKLAYLLGSMELERIILVGPRLSKYTYPKLKPISKSIIEKFDGPKEALDYLTGSIQGKEILLFKGARFLEGIIEHLLLNKSDVAKLCRREKVWENRRRKWGL